MGYYPIWAYAHVQDYAKGERMAEYPPIVYATAWNELYKCFGERMQQDEIDLMDAVLSGVTLDIQDEIQRQGDDG